MNKKTKAGKVRRKGNDKILAGASALIPRPERKDVSSATLLCEGGMQDQTRIDQTE